MAFNSASSRGVLTSSFLDRSDEPPRYTGSPWLLLTSDVLLFFRSILYLPCIFLPLFPWDGGSSDELYPSFSNLRDLGLHFILFFVQLGFLISLPFSLYLPAWLLVLYITTVITVNALVCRLLNGGIPETGLTCTEDEVTATWEAHPDEYWIFLNGICVGKHWLQNNVDRLSRTFHRPVVGVHNRTSGVVFDIVQCLIQRSLLFATSDVRECYVLVRKALYRPGIKKVVFILHSQGGIEGGMIVDWLLNEIPQELLQKLEIYTFGCLANHFNNPYQTSITSGVTGSGSNSHAAPTGSRRRRVISHIEHYANVFDFASRWGVLNFTQIKTFSRLENRYMGTVFVNPRSGHQLNQHYLDTIFPLDKTKKYVREPAPGDFMSMEVATYQPGTADREADNPLPSFYVPALYTALGGDASDSMFKVVMSAEMLNVSPTSPMTTSAFDKQDGSRLRETLATRRVQDLSRLWLYRNGGSPPN